MQLRAYSIENLNRIKGVWTMKEKRVIQNTEGVL